MEPNVGLAPEHRERLRAAGADVDAVDAQTWTRVRDGVPTWWHDCDNALYLADGALLPPKVLEQLTLFPVRDVVVAVGSALRSIASLLVGGDATDVDGTDLVAQLEGVTTDEGPSAGRIVDQSAFGDYANTIGQAFAAVALSRSGSDEAGGAVSFLLQQQCEAGYFRLPLTADADAEDQSCDAAEGQPSVDTTALVLNQLLELDATEDVTAAIDAAAAWLGGLQKDNGSFGTGVQGEGSNTNSTGLAGWALASVGSCGKARQAARWVKKLQVAGKHSDTALADEVGAIAFNRAAFTAGKTEGITVETRDQWRRAATQAAPSLQNLSKATCKQ